MWKSHSYQWCPSPLQLLIAASKWNQLREKWGCMCTCVRACTCARTCLMTISLQTERAQRPPCILFPHTSQACWPVGCISVCISCIVPPHRAVGGRRNVERTIIRWFWTLGFKGVQNHLIPNSQMPSTGSTSKLCHKLCLWPWVCHLAPAFVSPISILRIIALPPRLWGKCMH